MHLTDISIPDSLLCKQATQLVAEFSPTFLYNHCVRTYIFGDLLGRRDGLKYDRELLYLSAILHDLGLLERFDGGQRFEVDGADAAQAFVTKHGLPPEKAEIIWDAIALHTSLGIAARKRPEIALVHLGAGADVFGLADIPPEAVERTLDAYPRLNFKEAITELLIAQVRKKPQWVMTTFLADVGRCRVHGFTCPSWDDMLRRSPFAE